MACSRRRAAACSCGERNSVCVGTQRLRHCSYLSTRPRSRRSSAVADARPKSSRRFIAVPPDSACDRAGHTPPRARSCVGPSSAMRPSCTTKMRLACRIVERRWAMMSVVRPMLSWSNARWMRASVTLSSAEVASSRMRMGGFSERRARWRRAASSAGEERSALANVGVKAVGHGLDILKQLRPCARPARPRRPWHRGGCSGCSRGSYRRRERRPAGRCRCCGAGRAGGCGARRAHRA